MTKKRILAMTLSLLLILCLSGCGRKEASLGTESTAITETSDAAAETRFLINGAEELTDEQIDTALKRWIEYSENLRKVLGSSRKIFVIRFRLRLKKSTSG